ncbi:hypothetical protein DF110_24825 [Burkholderia stagnalis]|nr:hypothetical protein DF110_24825 [Burkholderia stagnalis]
MQVFERREVRRSEPMLTFLERLCDDGILKKSHPPLFEKCNQRPRYISFNLTETEALMVEVLRGTRKVRFFQISDHNLTCTQGNQTETRG